MRRFRVNLLTVSMAAFLGSCTETGPGFVVLPVDTRFSFVNFSREFYAVLGVREHDATGDGPFAYTPLLAPGAVYREDFPVFLDSACPGSLDLRVLLYRRVADDVPIGLDPGETVEPVPVAAGEVQNVPACDVRALETYTIVNWDAPAGIARVKIAQCDTEFEQAFRARGLFDNDDVVWEVTGVDPALATIPPPEHAPSAPIVGRVVLTDGTGVPGVGVLIRTKYRSRIDCSDPSDPDETGYGEPIDFDGTDEEGRFVIDRPAGVYEIELFSDDYLFRPAVMRVETPLDPMTLLAEPTS